MAEPVKNEPAPALPDAVLKKLALAEIKDWEDANNHARPSALLLTALHPVYLQRLASFLEKVPDDYDDRRAFFRDWAPDIQQFTVPTRLGNAGASGLIFTANGDPVHGIPPAPKPGETPPPARYTQLDVAVDKPNSKVVFVREGSNIVVTFPDLNPSVKQNIKLTPADLEDAFKQINDGIGLSGSQLTLLGDKATQAAALVVPYGAFERGALFTAPGVTADLTGFQGTVDNIINLHVGDNATYYLGEHPGCLALHIQSKGNSTPGPYFQQEARIVMPVDVARSLKVRELYREIPVDKEEDKAAGDVRIRQIIFVEDPDKNLTLSAGGDYLKSPELEKAGYQTLGINARLILGNGYETREVVLMSNGRTGEDKDKTRDHAAQLKLLQDQLAEAVASLDQAAKARSEKPMEKKASLKILPR